MFAACRVTSIRMRQVLRRRCSRRRTATLGILDPDRLRIHERVGSEMRELPSVPAVFHAADRHARIRRGDAVDEDSTRIEVARDPAGQLDIRGPEIAAQPELASVRCSYARIDVMYPRYCGNRPEGLLIECRHALGYSAQHSRRIKGALARDRLPAAQHACSFRDAAFDLLVERVAKIVT